MTIGELSGRTGISVKTLRFYSDRGLLPPDGVSEGGYRLYSDAALPRLRAILYYRELGFTLEEIKGLAACAMPPREELARQRGLLLEQRARLDRLIRQIEKDMEGKSMGFQVFDDKDMAQAREEYAKEAKQRWGNTPAYKQSKERLGGKNAAGQSAAFAELDGVFALAARLRQGDPAGEEGRRAVTALKACITANFYDCTPEILAGLGEMYSADPRFRENIDRHGEGTADFLTRAIREMK